MSKTYWRVALLGAVLSHPLTLFAAFGSSDKSSSAGDFLKIGVGARAAGMGEAYSAVADDASALYWNPAALLQIQGHSATFMHALLLDSLDYEYLAYGHSFGQGFGVGASFQMLSAGRIQETDSSGFPTGTQFSPEDLAVSFGGAYQFEYVGIGISLKYIRSTIIETASTFANDVGVLSPKFLDERVRLSFVMQNIGGGVHFDQEADPLPLNIKFGSSFLAKENWIAAFDLNFPRDNQPYVALGTEYRFSQGPDWDFFGRMGLNSRTLGDVSGFTGFSFGLGARLKRYEFDYALNPVGSLGQTHTLSAGVRF